MPFIPWGAVFAALGSLVLVAVHLLWWRDTGARDARIARLIQVQPVHHERLMDPDESVRMYTTYLIRFFWVDEDGMCIGGEIFVEIASGERKLHAGESVIIELKEQRNGVLPFATRWKPAQLVI